MVFPLGIKMRLVRELQLLTNANAKAKAASLQTTQQRFLANMDSCILWELATLDLANKATKTNLQQLIMAIPNPDWPEHWLFHSINKMYLNSSYIFCFKPAKAQSMREIVAGLLIFLKGIWKDHIDTENFNKFFTCSAIKWAKDAWWDSQNHCVVMRADTELDQILKLDQDLFFLDMAVEVEMGNLAKQDSNKKQTDLMSMGSILTFRSTGMTTNQETRKHQACKTQKSQPNIISNQVLVMTGATLSAQENNTLLKCLLMPIKCYASKKLIIPTQKAASSQQTGKTK